MSNAYATPCPCPCPCLKIIHFPVLFKRKHSLGPWCHWPGTRNRRPTSSSARQPRWVGLSLVEHPGRRPARQWAPAVLNSSLSRTGPLELHRAVCVFARTNHAGQKEVQNCKHISQERMLSADSCPYPYLEGYTLPINSRIFALGVRSLGLP